MLADKNMENTQDKSWENKLYYGDNLEILRDKIPDNSVDLIYLDPPFQSGKSYNQIFQPRQGEVKGATAQITAFEDTWEWGPEAEKSYDELITGRVNKEKPNQRLIDLIKALRSYLGEVPMMAYLSMMAPRLLEMRRVLKDTGSIYLHCDPTASHYLKLLMDAVFDGQCFRNEIIWRYRRWPAKQKAFQRMHDTILFYTKTWNNTHTFNQKFEELAKSTIEAFGKKKQLADFSSGHRKPSVLEEESPGASMSDVWEIGIIAPISKERVGYPTQKPEALLERIIESSSNRDDLVLDPFCGCGTTVAVAQKLGRRWVGIDITYLAIDVIAKRLGKSGLKKGIDFEIGGEPKDTYSAEKLAQQAPFQFQIWCISKLNATPSLTKSGDQGIDGIINFFDPIKKDKAGKGIVQVKGTQSVNPGMVRDLKGTMKSQNADFGILVTLKKPTKGMVTEAVKEGYFELKYMPNTTQQKIPKIQFLTTGDLFKEPLPITLPPATSVLSPFKKPIIEETKDQKELF